MKGGQQPKHKLLVQTLSAFFGFGSWIAMTGLWMELPLLTQKLPESWSLGSYLTVMIQLANIGPIIYWFARVNKLCSEVAAIHLQMMVGTVACIALIFWWDTTAIIWEKERSIVLYLASFGLSIVDCTSSVVFLPYMARFRGHHMTPYLIGEGLSGFLPTLVVLAQGVSEEVGECPITPNTNDTSHTEPWQDFDQLQSNLTTELVSRVIKQPRFSANIFFCFLLLILLISWISFGLMEYLPRCQTERIDLGEGHEEDVELEVVEKMLDVDDVKPETSSPLGEQSWIKFNQEYVWLLGLMLLGCFTTFGAMPAIQSYSTLPYGGETFFYAVTLSGLAYPGACVLGLFLQCRGTFVINALTGIGFVIGGYIFVCGLLSPNPPFKEGEVGSVVMCLSWFSYVGIISYMKTMVSLELNRIGGNPAMLWCGFAQQFGAASGGAVIFFVINYTNAFKEENDCD